MDLALNVLRSTSQRGDVTFLARQSLGELHLFEATCAINSTSGDRDANMAFALGRLAEAEKNLAWLLEKKEGDVDACLTSATCHLEAMRCEHEKYWRERERFKKTRNKFFAFILIPFPFFVGFSRSRARMRWATTSRARRAPWPC